MQGSGSKAHASETRTPPASTANGQIYLLAAARIRATRLINDERERGDSMTFYAHSLEDRPQAEWEPLKLHLQTVASEAGKRAAKFGAMELGHIAGLLHDLGKYTDEFQKRLAGSPKRVDHAAPGARIACDRYGQHIGKLLAFGIAGHHAGLSDANPGGALDLARTPLNDRLRNCGNVAEQALAAAVGDGLSIPNAPSVPSLRARKGFTGFQVCLLGRMLFSCLVDADYVETERFYASVEGRTPDRDSSPSLDALASALDGYLHELAGGSGDTPVNRLRGKILTHVRAMADQAQGVFTLTAPTGGGKTLASLAFALDHAKYHRLDRVIFVIPFTSIIDQTADVYRAALAPHGYAVLEHHSAFDESRLSGREGFEKLELAMENWAAPVIVTTAVQFFESLFADRPSRCRKLHNIARSVVILDEAQTLPQHLLRPCVALLDELARNYRASIVLSTATQPALRETTDPQRSFRGGFTNVRELALDPPSLFAALKRVSIEVVQQPLADSELVARVGRVEQTLCVVNTRAHARELYELIGDLPGARHLSTLMCAMHRRQVLAAIRNELKNGKPCRVVATSLVEAGVDLDFPFVLRAESGLDSLAQAAGRCNREGWRPAETSVTVVFEAADHSPPKSMRARCEAGRAALRRFAADPLGPEAVEFFFHELYWSVGEERLDRAGIIDRCERSTTNSDFEYASIAADFRMIDDVMLPVIVPFDERARGFLRELEFVEKPGALARRLQPYTVPVPPDARNVLIAAGAAAPVREREFGDQFVRLLNEDLYDHATGLNWNEPTFRRAEGLMG
jgi:CRISPR-associated endonuclease/helicase Cas3